MAGQLLHTLPAMSYTIGLATTFHDPALALVGPYDASPQSQAILCVVLCSVTLAGTGFSRSVSSYSAFAATLGRLV